MTSLIGADVFAAFQLGSFMLQSSGTGVLTFKSFFFFNFSVYRDPCLCALSDVDLPSRKLYVSVCGGVAFHDRNAVCDLSVEFRGTRYVWFVLAT